MQKMMAHALGTAQVIIPSHGMVAVINITGFLSQSRWYLKKTGMDSPIKDHLV